MCQKILCVWCVLECPGLPPPNRNRLKSVANWHLSVAIIRNIKMTQIYMTVHCPLRNKTAQSGINKKAGPETPWRLGREVGDALQRHQMLCNEHRPAPRNHVHVPAEQHTPEVSLFKPLSRNFILRPSHLEPTHQQHHQEGKKHPWIHSKESPSMPNCLQKNCLPEYLALVRPLLDYGAIIWDPYQKQDISKMERIQRNAVRFIARDYKSKTPGSVTRLLTKARPPYSARTAWRPAADLPLQGGWGAGSSTPPLKNI